MPCLVVDEPELNRTLIPTASRERGKAICGLTILGEELFVVSYSLYACPEIEVFGDLEKLESIRELSLKGQQLDIPWDIQSSPKKGCLYIVNVKRNEEEDTEIIEIDREGYFKKKWPTDCIACHLSVTNESNVIVTSLYKSKIKEYSSDGKLIREIELPSSVGIVNPWVTLKRGKNKYIIAHGNRGDSQHRVYLIDLKKDIKYNFGGGKGSNNDQLQVPIHMAAYSDGHILVADKNNNRVMLLSPELQFLKVVFSEVDELRYPYRICLDEGKKKMFVGDNQWTSHIKPWKNGRVLVFDMSGIQNLPQHSLGQELMHTVAKLPIIP